MRRMRQSPPGAWRRAAQAVARGWRDQRGSVLPTALVVTAVISLLLVPLLEFASAALRRALRGDTALVNLYSTDAASEDALWRLMYDPTYRDALLYATPQPYTVAINDQNVSVSISLHIPTDPTPTPVATPTPKPGNSPLSWTMMDPAVVNLAANPNPTVRVTYYIHNPGTAQATITTMDHILPRGWQYAGNLSQQGFVDSHGGVYTLAELVPVTTDCSTSSPPCWTYTGPDPYLSCQSRTVNQVAGYQRLEWDWSQGRGAFAPRVDPGVLAHFSFDIRLASPVQPGIYYDSPWTYVSQQQCGGNQLQAGGPSSIMIVVSAQVDATSEDGTVTSTTRARVNDATQIELHTVR